MLYVLMRLSHAVCSVKKESTSFDLCVECDDPSASSSAPGSGKTFSAQMSRPTSEAQMYRLLNAFVILCQATSLASSLALCPFFEEVVYDPVASGSVHWCVAFECVIVYLRMLEAQGPSGTYTISNIVYRAGGIDSIRSQAARIARDHYPAAFFRPHGGNPWTGEVDKGGEQKGKLFSGTLKGFNTSSTVPCRAWNLGEKHAAKNVDPNGCCKLLHACDQFVTDKGPRGQCLGNHKRADCTYDPAKKVSAPVGA